MPRLMKVMEIDISGAEAILAEARSGRTYADIAGDWLVPPNYVGWLLRHFGYDRRHIGRKPKYEIPVSVPAQCAI